MNLNSKCLSVIYNSPYCLFRFIADAIKWNKPLKDALTVLGFYSPIQVICRFHI